MVRSVVVVVVTGVELLGGWYIGGRDTGGGEEIGGWNTVCWGTGGTGGAVVEEYIGALVE